ncbi:hypothetical protein [Microbispora sp. NPDC049633]|uniref:hypothetical protein n=1 Tax=Microbispora sp. NPDC049633 TaxID=3154355 RepID=UPI00342AB79A
MTMNWELATQVAKDRRARVENSGRWMDNPELRKAAVAHDRERYKRQAAAHYKSLQEAAQARRAGKAQPKQAPLADKQSASPNARADWGPSRAPSADAVDLSRWDTPSLKPRTPGKWGDSYGRVEHGEPVLGGQWPQPERQAPPPAWSKTTTPPPKPPAEPRLGGQTVGNVNGVRISTAPSERVPGTNLPAVPHLGTLSKPPAPSPNRPSWGASYGRVEHDKQVLGGQWPQPESAGRQAFHQPTTVKPPAMPSAPATPAPNNWIENRPRSTPTPPTAPSPKPLTPGTNRPLPTSISPDHRTPGTKIPVYDPMQGPKKLGGRTSYTPGSDVVRPEEFLRRIESPIVTQGRIQLASWTKDNQPKGGLRGNGIGRSPKNPGQV